MNYILYDEKGIIKEMGKHDSISIEDIRKSNPESPESTVKEISDEDYKNLEGKLENFRVSKKKVEEKSQKELTELKIAKEDWIKNNTLQGLNRQIQELKTKIK